jgi:hypothetical protein
MFELFLQQYLIAVTYVFQIEQSVSIVGILSLDYTEAGKV